MTAWTRHIDIGDRQDVQKPSRIHIGLCDAVEDLRNAKTIDCRIDESLPVCATAVKAVISGIEASARSDIRSPRIVSLRATSARRADPHSQRDSSLQRSNEIVR